MTKLWTKTKSNSSIPLVLSIVLGMAIGSIILMITGTNPFELLEKMFNRSFSNTRLFLQFLQEFGLLMLLGLSAFFSMKVGFFNIGAPGQMVFSGMCASLFALHTNMPTGAHALLTTLVAIIAAIVYTMLAAILKIYFGVNDVVATVLLNWIALEILKAIFFNTSAFTPDASRTTPATPSVPNTSDWVIENVVQNAVFSITIFIAVAAMMISFFIMRYTKLGYKINVVGKNERAAYIAGYNSRRITFISIAISGLMIGLFAMGYYLGKNNQMSDVSSGIPPALGFNGLILYMMAGKSVVGLAFSALLMDFLQGPSSQNIIGIPASAPQIFAASIIYCVAIVKLFERWWDIKGYTQTKVHQIRKIFSRQISKKEVN